MTLKADSLSSEAVLEKMIENTIFIPCICFTYDDAANDITKGGTITLPVAGKCEGTSPNVYDITN